MALVPSLLTSLGLLALSARSGSFPGPVAARVLAAGAAQAPATVAQAAERGAPGPQTQGESRPDPLRTAYHALAAVPLEELPALAQASLAADPRPTLDALILLAGRPVPATLGSATTKLRRARRDQALAVLREALVVPGSSRELGLRRLAELEQGTAAQLELRCAGLRVVGDLGLLPSLGAVELALRDPEPALRQAASDALFALTGRWFSRPTEWDAHRTALEGLPPDPRLAGPLREAHRELRTVLGALFVHEPQRALEALARPHPDPELRALAATRLRDAVGREQLALEDVAAGLQAQLAREADGRAFAAEFGVLLDLAAGAPLGSPLTESLREQVTGMALDGPRFRLGVLLDGLDRLGWSADPSAPRATGEGAGARTATRLLLRMLGGALPHDADELARALDSWRAFQTRHPEGLRALSDNQMADLDRALRTVLARPDVPETLQVAAAACQPLFGDAQLSTALQQVGDPAVPRPLRLELLTLLRNTLLGPPAPEGSAPGVRPASETQRTVAVELLARLADPELGLRTAALTALTDGAAAWPGAQDEAPFGLTAKAWLDPLLEALARGLSDGGDRSQLPGLLLLLGEVQGPSHLARLLEEPGFAPLWSLEGAERDQVVVAAAHLVDGDGDLALRTARRLARPPAERDPTTLAAALRLVLGMPNEVARALPRSAQLELLGWAHELRRVRGRAPLEPGMARRLREVHLSALGELGDLAASERARMLHLWALLEGDALEGDAELDTVVLRFDQARAAAREALPATGEGPLPVSELEVRRDLARLLDRVAQSERAAQAYADLAREQESAGFPEGDARGLSSEDRRRGAQLILSSEALGPAPERARLALGLLAALVRSPSWEAAPNERRLGDLEALAQAAEAVGSEAALEQVLGLVGAVSPPLPEASYELGQVPAEVPEFATRSLCLGREAHVRLRAVHDRLHAALERVTAASAGTPGPTPAGEAAPGPADGPGPDGPDGDGTGPGTAPVGDGRRR